MERGQRFDDLARQLQALASPTRLQILHQLRVPHQMSEIRVQPSLSRGEENPGRPLARQSVSHHVDQLTGLGLLQKVPTADGRGEAYTIHQASLFALLDEVRRLAKLRSVVAEEAGETVMAKTPPQVRLPPTPRLLLAYGQDDGAAFALDAQKTSWRIGRGVDCEVRLDHDPWISTEHAMIGRADQGFTINDQHSRNGTWVDWKPLVAARPTPLKTGSLVMAGRSLLVFQD